MRIGDGAFMAVTTFTTYDQVARRLSATGVDLRIDHTPLDGFQEANEQASLYVLFYLGQRWPASVLATSDWVANVTADICIWFLDQFRNNPVSSSADGKKEMWDQLLQMIQHGKATVPDLPNSVDRPEVSNYRIDYSRYPSVRNTRQGSTQYRPSGYPRHPDRTEPENRG